MVIRGLSERGQASAASVITNGTPRRIRAPGANFGLYRTEGQMPINERMPADPIVDPDRLNVLRELSILDTPAEPAYDDIARLAAACCQSEIAAVNFVDGERHWTKAIVGVEGGQGASVSADLSFCAATVATPGGLLSVPDTTGSAEWSLTRS